eukprot:CAMPEP_0181320248 /NCGR_PEP_ID=MMETSP1101-20121128/18016_1 /TAXON_ID=46948 /ORGANISM="Rhodomonas abbreviata, Strain Caron Lab Isolate" /LENGTH=88 /DNA_ID=CAMNT_0023427927 /DNA_START=68 /DNA_END=334 /DNA_ORIENTATION=+
MKSTHKDLHETQDDFAGSSSMAWRLELFPEDDDSSPSPEDADIVFEMLSINRMEEDTNSDICSSDEMQRALSGDIVARDSNSELVGVF